MLKNKELQLALQYRQLAYVRFSFHYYTICEMVEEGYMENPFTDYRRELDALNQAIPDLLEKKENGDVLNQIRDLRQSIMKQMEILTAYTDRLQIYEYIFNRIEFRFEEGEQVDAQKLADEVFQYIFANQDNTMIYDKLSLVLSQLPVRMTKSRFYDMLRECLSIYAGTSRDALDGFVSNLKQIAMLTPIETKPEFQHIHDFVQQCNETDYKTISHDDFHHMQHHFHDIAQGIETCVNGYMQLQELCNVCNVIALTNELNMEDNDYINNARIIGDNIYMLFQGKGTMEDVELSLGQFEGVQERGLEQIMVLEAKLQEKDSVLEECELLMGSSIFVDPSVKPDNRPVDEAYLQETTEQFVEELSVKMKENQKLVNRAIMAGILGNIPNIFTSQQEIYDYIQYTLTSAGQEEQKASKALLTPIMMEE